MWSRDLSDVRSGASPIPAAVALVSGFAANLQPYRRRDGGSAARIRPRSEHSMKAQDLMTPDVIVVQPETPAKRVAALLLEHRISACPVVDASGAPIGIVSEWDLIFRLLA